MLAGRASPAVIDKTTVCLRPKAEQIAVRRVLRANNSEVLFQTGLDGFGVLLMLTWLVAPYVEQGRLVVLLPDFCATLDGITLPFSLYILPRVEIRQGSSIRQFHGGLPVGASIVGRARVPPLLRAPCPLSLLKNNGTSLLAR
jgi:DNA-binding transcriptional LysR family regulator